MNMMFTLEFITLKHINSIFQKNERITELYIDIMLLLPLVYQCYYTNEFQAVELFNVYAQETLLMWLVLYTLIQDVSIFSVIDLTSRKQH